MRLDLPILIVSLTSLGFKVHAHEPHFGTHLEHVVYMHKVSEREGRATHTYLHLITYGGRLIEVAAETYLAPKNSRAPKGRDTKRPDAKWSDWQIRGFSPVVCTLVRSNAEVLAFCS